MTSCHIQHPRETLSEISNFKHFLIVVSRNRAFDSLKKQLKEEQRRRAWEKDNKADVYIQPDEAASSRSSLIDQAIDSLPPRRKEVYLLSRHERLSYNEIAGRLKISRESVKTHLMLATRSISDFIRSHLPALVGLACISNIF